KQFISLILPYHRPSTPLPSIRATRIQHVRHGLYRTVNAVRTLRTKFTLCEDCSHPAKKVRTPLPVELLYRGLSRAQTYTRRQSVHYPPTRGLTPAPQVQNP